MKPDKDIKGLWREAAQGDNTRLQPITSGEAEKAEAEKPQEISGDDPLLNFVLNRWNIAASEVEAETGCTIRD